MSNRDEFLNHIATKLQRKRGRKVTKPTWKHRVQWEILNDKNIDELIDMFEKQCHKNHTTLKRVSVAQLQDTLRETILHYGGGPIVSGKDDRFEQFGLSTLLEQLDVVYLNELHRKQVISIAERANIGITFSDITLAESATVTLFHDRNNSRSISLLPTNYIALIPIETIVPRLTHAMKMIHEKVLSGSSIPSCITFVSGPSNSADIESHLVHGVHGPVEATFIIIDH